MNFVLLNSGHVMPKLGLGTYRVKAYDILKNVVEAALLSGYRLFDTAESYGNEQTLAPQSQGPNAYQSVLNSCKNLKTDYIDLYLIHWPGTSKLKPDDHKNKESRIASWSCLEQMVKEGRLKNIGVSNFNINHLENLVTNCTIKPAVNQVEFHPYIYQTQKKLLAYCQSPNLNIQLQSYSSLGGQNIDSKETTVQNQLLNDSTLLSLAKNNHFAKNPAQILLKWSIQHGSCVIPKSIHQSRVESNAKIFDFELTSQEIAILDDIRIRENKKDVRFCWDPSEVV
ncbi:unnamed protein product [Gordionus sp. m RMFG-2023]|uniref:uncharacterized oxidoreductase YtbE-like isoform X2 n=1 Tax=Gordionus sp. m RMFG-2023 TaxID=3053472 RepID=UPI0030E12E0D